MNRPHTPAGVATGAPVQLLPPEANGAATDTALVGLPVPKPVSPVQLLLSQANGAATDTVPVGPPDPESLEHYLEASADAQAAVTANDNVIPTHEDNLSAAVAVIEAGSSFDATVDAYKALAAIIAAFEEAESRPDDE